MTEDQPVINIQGEKVALGPMRRDLIPLYYRWLNDLTTMRLAGYPLRPRTLEEQTASFERNMNATDSVLFTIYEVESWQPIGTTSLMNIDRSYSTAELGISIWEQAARGKGYGTEAVQLVLDYAFNALVLNSVMLTTGEYNIAGQKAYAKAGFKEFGRRRQADMMGGKLCDLVYMDCLASEFQSPALEKLFTPDPVRED